MSVMNGGSAVVFEGCELAETRRETEVTKAVERKLALGGSIKRVLDIVLASTGLLILAPLFVLVAAAVKLSSRGPIFYGHTRIGFDGRAFKCLKFRTMVADGGALLEQYLEKHPNERRNWDVERKLRTDPRVTSFGRVMRSYSVDELPQLINVVRGEMSIVGPRPVVSEELQQYGQCRELYLATRPGITGLWQTSGRSDVGYSQRVSLDADYVNNWSVWSDVKIIAKTIPAVISAEGSY